MTTVSPPPPEPPKSGNPNAAVAGTSSGIGVFVIWVLTNVWPKVDLSAEAGGAIVGAVATVLLFVGRNGLAGVWRIIVHGGAK